MAITTFCWLPPESVATGSLVLPDLDLELLDHRFHGVALGGAVDDEAAREPAQRGQGDVVGDRHRQHQALGLPVLRDERDALVGAGRRHRARHEALLALDADGAGDVAEDAEEGEQDLALALAVEAAEADDLALADREGNVEEAVGPAEST